MQELMISACLDAVMLAQSGDFSPEDAIQQAVQNHDFEPTPKEYNLLLHAVRVDSEYRKQEANASNLDSITSS